MPSEGLRGIFPPQGPLLRLLSASTGELECTTRDAERAWAKVKVQWRFEESARIAARDLSLGVDLAYRGHPSNSIQLTALTEFDGKRKKAKSSQFRFCAFSACAALRSFVRYRYYGVY